mgnify:CR=1 FL=1
MSLYKQKLNPVSGQFNLVPTGTIITFKDGVANFAALPSSGNTINDARVINDTGHLYVWNGTSWVDQGDILDLEWSAINGKPSSSVVDIDSAVSLKHASGSDDQDLSGKVDKVTGSSLVLDTEIAKIHVAEFYKFLTFNAKNFQSGATNSSPASALGFGASATNGSISNYSVAAFGALGSGAQNNIGIFFEMPSNYTGTPITLRLQYFTNTTANTGGPGAAWEVSYQKVGNDVETPAIQADSLTKATETALVVASTGRIRHYRDSVILPFTNQGLPVAGDWLYIGVRRTYAGGVGVEYSSPLLLANLSILY